MRHVNPNLTGTAAEPAASGAIQAAKENQDCSTIHLSIHTSSASVAMPTGNPNPLLYLSRFSGPMPSYAHTREGDRTTGIAGHALCPTTSSLSHDKLSLSHDKLSFSHDIHVTVPHDNHVTVTHDDHVTVTLQSCHCHMTTMSLSNDNHVTSCQQHMAVYGDVRWCVDITNDPLEAV